MDQIQALGPVEFQFTAEQDVARYGDRWYRYSEEDMIRRPASELVEVERELDMALVRVMNAYRLRMILGDTVVAWLGLRDFDPKLAGPFDEFDPVTMLIRWRPSEADVDTELGKSPAPAATDSPADQDSPSPEPVDQSGDFVRGTSDRTDTVVLPTLPIAG